ncbi:choline/ethanolamine kinase family protein [Pseudoscardovia suis]|uniref:Choline/ethanolamine kinase n=1 Tax=Pseudoscardovia suis TaxID=987063 RepID=A0A261EXF6_9BIFI|nr:phosphotransferase [Pseudoscardovia suis]OZG51346.1 choline/ethanolamine kinase [Pseudoscardovia suis]PJJ68771.1 thiamine kinase-like enzyme [Pseudoscardovia suis]
MNVKIYQPLAQSGTAAADDGKTLQEAAPSHTPMVTEDRVRHSQYVVVPQDVLAAIEDATIWQGQTVTAKPMSGGLTNENWKVIDAQGTPYFLKVPGQGTGFIDRSNVDAGTLRASDLGIGAAVYEFDPDSGVEITEFLDGWRTCTTTSLRTQEEGLQAMDIYRKLHGGEQFTNTNTLFDQIDLHLDQLREHSIDVPSWVNGLIDEYHDVKARFLASGLDIVPCHNDPMPGNFMVKDHQMRIIDFDFCGNNEESCEVALFIAEMFYDDEDMLPLLEEYFGAVDERHLARVRAARVIGDIKWGLWGIINSVVRTVQFDYWKYGIWKLMRAYTYKNQLDWPKVKEFI